MEMEMDSKRVVYAGFEARRQELNTVIPVLQHTEIMQCTLFIKHGSTTVSHICFKTYTGCGYQNASNFE